MGRAVRQVALSLFLALVLVCYTGVSVHADMASPDSVDVPITYVFRNLAEDGDQLYLVEYNVAYATTPDDPITETFTFRLFTSNGSALLATANPYAYNDLGYGYGVVSFYFPTSDALTWGETYQVRIAGNPTKFTTPPVYNFFITESNYSDYTSQEDNQGALGTAVISMAQTLQSAWNTVLLEQTDVGTVLSAGGETYFRSAIMGLQVMAPDIFFVQTQNPTFPNRSWNMSLIEGYQNQWDGTFVAEGFHDVEQDFGWESGMFSGILCLAGVVGVMIFSAVKFKSTEGGVMGAVLITIFGGIMGWLSGAMLGISAFICVIGIGMIFLFRHAGG